MCCMILVVLDPKVLLDFATGAKTSALKVAAAS